MQISMGEQRWRILRKALRHLLSRRRKAATFTELRSYCRYAKEVELFEELVRIGALFEERPHRSKKQEGLYRLTAKGYHLADMGMVSYEDYKKFKRQKTKPRLSR